MRSLKGPGFMLLVRSPRWAAGALGPARGYSAWQKGSWVQCQAPLGQRTGAVGTLVVRGVPLFPGLFSEDTLQKGIIENQRAEREVSCQRLGPRCQDPEPGVERWQAVDRGTKAAMSLGRREREPHTGDSEPNPLYPAWGEAQAGISGKTQGDTQRRPPPGPESVGTGIRAG